VLSSLIHSHLRLLAAEVLVHICSHAHAFVRNQDVDSDDCTIDPVKNTPVLPENSVPCDIKIKVKQVRQRQGW